MVRVYVLSLKRGHGEVGLNACPSEKSAPEPEYWMVFRPSAPMAFETLLRTAFASGCPLVAAQALNAAAITPNPILPTMAILLPGRDRQGAAPGQPPGLHQKTSAPVSR